MQAFKYSRTFENWYYCPEINPIERLWLAIKQKLKWIIFGDLSDLIENFLALLHIES
ncbi:MAG: hypothetical protein MGG11_01240 [Trichodesmium sp. MAG_R03]|nr:hypothetical protein [Trichodesmium sp. MAG_R03]